jgi:hypothetical protein
MGHEPLLIDRVAVEPAAELVIDPARGHLLQGVFDHFERATVACAPVAAQQKHQGHRSREFRSASETAVPPVVGREEVGEG